jgi:hypothetical protein
MKKRKFIFLTVLEVQISWQGSVTGLSYSKGQAVDGIVNQKEQMHGLNRKPESLMGSEWGFYNDPL